MQKIFKKKLYTDYLICQEELYILSMIRSLDDREEIKKQNKEIIDKRNKIIIKENESDSVLKDKAKILHNEVVFDLDSAEANYLKQIRCDPYFFVDREKMKFGKKYGNKNYREFDSKKKIDEPQKISENEIIAINNKLYVYLISLI